MEAYCGSEFWNDSLTWNTDDPDFTPCFEDTVFVWAPCLFLFVFSISDIYNAGLVNKRLRPIIWTRKSVSKVILAIVAIMLNLARTFSNPRHALLPLHWLNFIVTTVTFVLFILLVRIHRSQGVHTSGTLFIFWILNSLFNAAILRTTVKLFQEHDLGILSLVTELLYFVTVLLQAVSHCWSDHSTFQHSCLEDSTQDKKSCPELKASFLSRILFSWVTTLTVVGYRKPLENDDVWELRRRDKSAGISSVYSKYWKRPEPVHVQSNGSIWRNIVHPIWFVVYADFYKAQISYFLNIVTGFLMPQIMDWLITFVEDPNSYAWKGYLLAILMLVAAVSRSIFLNYFYLVSMQLYVNCQAALVPILYRKTLVISSNARKDFSAGEITNLMTVDVNKIRELLWSSNLPWSTPLQFGLALYFLWAQLGISVLVGFGVLFLLVPVNWVIYNYLSTSQNIQMKTKDERVKMMNEILSGMKILKFFGWEPSFQDQVQEIRAREIQNLRYQSYLNSLMELVFQASPFLVALATFATYTWIDPSNRLDPRKAFVSIALFNMIKVPINDFPRFVSQFAKSRTSFQRINKFLNAEENDPNAVNWIPLNAISSEEDSIADRNVAVEVKDASFRWTDEAGQTLNKINIKIQKGQLVAIVGAVASGKSSLLSAILGEMKKVVGKVTVIDSLAYVPQIAWIRNSTLKDNILFGSKFDDAKYQKVLESCALKPDLAILPGGDETEIGEKGINLSGGQKQRVALARAAYHEAEVFLFDDPLSAVDVHVAEHLFEKLIGPTGMLGSKTRIMVTHSVTYLSQMDQIIVMKDGTVTECGTYKELQDSKGAFSEFLAQHVCADEEETMDENSSEIKKDAEDEVKKTGAGTKLIEAEAVESGTVKFQVYLQYFQAIGWPTIAIIVFFYVVAQVFSVGTNVWLSVWVTDSNKNRTTEDEEYAKNVFLGVYTALGISQSLTYLFGVLFVYVGSLFASQKLHNQMLSRILRAPMSFFDTTPLGRIINRFGEDTEAMDSYVCWDFVEWITAFCQFIGILAIISFSLPLFIAVIVPASGIFYLIQSYYSATTRQLNRLTTVLRSPLYSHYGETLAANGTACIGAFRVKGQFIEQLENKLNSFMAALFALLATRRWLSIRLECLSALLVFAASLFAVMARSTLSAGIVALAITYALQITDTLSWLTKVTSFLDPDMVCVERVLQYIKTVEQEAEYEIEDKKPPKEWPQNGEIKFENVNLRYREGLDLVLKNVTFLVKPGEKVGVVGRTGAGKSSLTTALFRIIELAEEGAGSIQIDGVDLGQLGLKDVRRCLTIIPQDPVLFSGTLRMNLDPFSEYGDGDLWDALAHARLKAYVDTLGEGVEYKVAAGGENLSVGQRQLVCIARAILRKPKILILDEATAAIDLETDDLIQKTIRSEFVNCTVLTIAHRLNTIMDSNRILVLDNGQVMEFDTPANLLAKQDSIFYSMAVGAGMSRNVSSRKLNSAEAD